MGAALAALLSVLTIAVNGYHPFAEDGGIYLAGIKHLLNPTLYPFWTGFVTAHLRFSLFAPAVVAMAHVTSLPLMTVMLLLHLATVWLTLFAAWLLTVRCFAGTAARCGAVTLLACWIDLPVAGTSLMLMDPYVSARSLSTPCSLFALVGMMDTITHTGSARRNGLALCGAALLLAAATHPLMGGYAAACVVLLACVSAPRHRKLATTCWCVAAFALATCVHLLSPANTAAYAQVALTRSYWFLAQWQLYELFGIVAPLLILWYFARTCSRATVSLARAAGIAGITAVVIALVYARMSAPTYLVARLQPLRILQTVYIVMILCLGAALGERVLQRHALRWLTFVPLAMVMFVVQRQTFPGSNHLELPGLTPRNQWRQGFEWIRDHVPANEAFAVDANYVTIPGEDAQNFRAIAEHSAMPDYSKDGGIAAIAPDLAVAWQQGQINLTHATDAQRIAALRNTPVSWIVLPRFVGTSLQCVYRNAAMQVCRLPER